MTITNIAIGTARPTHSMYFRMFWLCIANGRSQTLSKLIITLSVMVLMTPNNNDKAVSFSKTINESIL